MKCPVCKTYDLVISDRQNIEIDYCPNCRGVWLDRGELDKIIERANTLQRDYETRPHPPRKHYDDDLYPGKRKNDERYREDHYHSEKPYHDDDRRYYDDKRRYKKRRRDSIFGEIFDIFD